MMRPAIAKNDAAVLLILAGAVIGGLGLHYVGGAAIAFGTFLAFLEDLPGRDDSE